MPDPRDAVVTGALDAASPGEPVDDGTPGRPVPRTGLLDGLALRTRLVGILVVALVAALTVTGYGVQYVLRGYLVAQIDQEMDRVVSSIYHDDLRRFFAEDLPRGRLPLAPDYVAQVSVDGASQTVTLWHGMGGDDEDAPVLPRPTAAEAAAHLGEFRTVRSSDGHEYRITTFSSPPGTKVTLSSGERGPAAVTIARRLDDVEHSVAKLRIFTLLLGTGVTVLVSLVGWALIRRSFRPLGDVERTAAAIAAGDLSQRVPERPATTEVGRLTHSLNGMLSRIESAFRDREASEARTRRFAADASHELRTPLVSIRGFAELYRQGAVPPEEVPRTMRRIEDEAKRMGSLVEDLLLLARLDAQRAGRLDPVDLRVLAGDAVHDARGLAPDRDVRLVALAEGSPGPAVVTGDEDRLRQVVANLVANAVRHTPAGTPIEVAAGRDGDACVLEVRDHGAGLSAEDAEKVFERFYRVDASRRRDTGGGSGLGLSIVAAVVGAHRGTVSVARTDGGGATFRVRLPARTGAPDDSPEPPGAERRPPDGHAPPADR